jgi:hypothetical protein
MELARAKAGPCSPPFPVYEDLVARMLAAHVAVNEERNPLVAHVLGVCAGYAYSDIDTVAMIMARMGFDGHTCVRITQVVDSMYVFSTAYLIQSRCGRLLILCYRGTEPANLINWVGDNDVGSDLVALGDETLKVHSGFHRNVVATQLPVIEELKLALEGKSLLDPGQRVEHPAEALFVTGHSLGGSMAALFALSIVADSEHRAIAEKLRAVYTFGQPLSVAEPLPRAVRELAPRLFRHAIASDMVPRLPAQPAGRLVHFGREYRYANSQWRSSQSPIVQLKNIREVPRSMLAEIGVGRGRRPPFTLADHGAHRYIAALRFQAGVTEFGERV